MTGSPVTPDGRYIVVRGRLWRRADPSLDAERRQSLVESLMSARRKVRQALRAADRAGLAESRAAVDAAKRELGERGPVWWADSSPDFNRHLARKTPYAAWFERFESAALDTKPAPEAGSRSEE